MALFVRILVEVLDAGGVERGRAPLHSVHHIVLGQQQLGQIGAVLAGHAGRHGHINIINGAGEKNREADSGFLRGFRDFNLLAVGDGLRAGEGLALLDDALEVGVQGHKGSPGGRWSVVRYELCVSGC